MSSDEAFLYGLRQISNASLEVKRCYANIYSEPGFPKEISNVVFAAHAKLEEAVEQCRKELKKLEKPVSSETE